MENHVYVCFVDFDRQPSELSKFSNWKQSTILNRNVINSFTIIPENYQGTTKFQNKNNCFKTIKTVLFKTIVEIVLQQLLF